ncbi:class I SAM-dependent methyltransferase [Desulfosudis oleivorans]|uniref:Class I SAM-dependent methyltransferase n=1 Tax=Desulfosudis oleivorans (strain DSM 6200 / JCM 39069 / Hxd3) TaxID=96561 RepID=A8ZTX1_DESOH|nr:hypothetical protein [Desulfosudis oleivorans]ABW67904.1 hypothetical protein Dole_2100 [Desulfosudis oleivorans Hxd3]
MTQTWQRIIRIPVLWYRSVQDRLRQQRQKNELEEWEKKGRPAPPPHIIKQRMLAEYAGRFGLKILVETGTFYGDMVDAMKNTFERVYSIELSPALYQRAAERFRKFSHIKLIQGDSGTELGNLMATIDKPALFWLDGHYSAGETAKGEKETPVFEELGHIFNTTEQGHVILIDDARCFGTYPAYPTMEELTGFIRSKRPEAGIEVRDDSIRITPPRAAE